MGLATAHAFAEAGAAAVLSDINEDTLRTATDDRTTAGHQVLGVRCDVSDEDSVAAMVKATADGWTERSRTMAVTVVRRIANSGERLAVAPSP